MIPRSTSQTYGLPPRIPAKQKVLRLPRDDARRDPPRRGFKLRRGAATQSAPLSPLGIASSSPSRPEGARPPELSPWMSPFEFGILDEPVPMFEDLPDLPAPVYAESPARERQTPEENLVDNLVDAYLRGDYLHPDAPPAPQQEQGLQGPEWCFDCFDAAFDQWYDDAF